MILQSQTNGMRVGVIQSNYVPWRGYFDLIASVDLFIIYDDVQYSTGSWRNRNQLKTRDGLKWITVPVKKKLGMAIDETGIEYGHPWIEQHRGLLEASLGKCRYYSEVTALWEEGVGDRPRTISELNVRLIGLVCDYLGIRTPLRHSRAFALTGAKTDRLIHLLRAVGATTYLSGPTAKGYLENEKFRDNGIRLEYKTYDYGPYPQAHGEFAGAVSVLDLIANMGPDATSHLRSRTSNEVAVQ